MGRTYTKVNAHIEGVDGPFRYEVAKDLERFPLLQGVTMRYGGVSESPYESFNMGFHVEDDLRDVDENRRRLAQHLGIAVEQLVGAEQVHGSQVTAITEELVGAGSLSTTKPIVATDAMHTNVKQVGLLLLVADCVPVLIYDPKHEAIGVVHAGWRGAVGHLPLLTLEDMTRHYGTNVVDTYIYLGPSIGKDSFEVGEEVADVFREDIEERSLDGASIIMYPSEGAKPHIDLREYMRQYLVLAGVPASQITISPADTYVEEDYFSYRRDCGKTGRMALFAMLT